MRDRLRNLSDGRLLETCAGLRPDLTAVGEPEQAVKVALRMLGRRRHQHLVGVHKSIRLLPGEYEHSNSPRRRHAHLSPMVIGRRPSPERA